MRYWNTTVLNVALHVFSLLNNVRKSGVLEQVVGYQMVLKYLGQDGLIDYIFIGLVC